MGNVRRGSAAMLVTVGAICLLTSCADRMVALRYQSPAPATPLSNTQPVTIYQFVDQRGTEGDNNPHRVGGVYGGYGNRLAKVMTDVPFTRTLTSALASALQSRGVRATSAGDFPLIPGATRIPTPLAMAGDIRNFSTESRWGMSAHISGIVRVHNQTGQILIEKLVSARDSEGMGSGVFAGTDTLETMLNRTLALFVQRVVDDPDIGRALVAGGSSR
jgi:hypothetical protein